MAWSAASFWPCCAQPPPERLKTHAGSSPHLVAGSAFDERGPVGGKSNGAALPRRGYSRGDLGSALHPLRVCGRRKLGAGRHDGQEPDFATVVHGLALRVYEKLMVTVTAISCPAWTVIALNVWEVRVLKLATDGCCRHVWGSTELGQMSRTVETELMEVAAVASAEWRPGAPTGLWNLDTVREVEQGKPAGNRRRPVGYLGHRGVSVQEFFRRSTAQRWKRRSPLPKNRGE